ncbi:MAG TPA: N-acetylmuramoyl-L-alanine amidase [Candidatus Limnocylindria bacterium]|nr:N-acetylmuramoyl-L-alanine amidase [Candidatus Limnocylindria bacterium]
MSRSGRLVPALAAALILAACAPGTEPSPTRPSGSPVETVTPGPSASAPSGFVEPAPGSSSAIYPPNPGAIVVAIDPGHGGCLDWGVPDPSERGVELSEKQLTLEIGLRLRELLVADGIGAVMTREDDEALAGDHHPELGCTGPAWRDVNGDGEAGFDPAGNTRTRDELQARLDLANLAAADALVSIHINSPFDGGQSIEIAFSETFYTDETPWGATLTERLAREVEAGVVARLGEVADYERGDRGVTAHNFYIVAPPLLAETDERPNRWAQPTRGGLMPVVLAEVGSITLRAEHDLLASATGRDAVASGIFDGLAAFFGARELAGRIGLDGVPVGAAPEVEEGDGPPYWASSVPEGPLRLRLTNTGTAAWPVERALVAGWQASEEPYLAMAPSSLQPLEVDVPALAPGESTVVAVELPEPPAERALAWISLSVGDQTLADLGSPALQLASGAP